MSVWLCHFHSFLLSKLQIAAKFSYCSNALNFEAKINCNTFKTNVPKWRKKCTGLKFDLLHFYGPQSHILSGGNLWGPCSIGFYRLNMICHVVTAVPSLLLLRSLVCSHLWLTALCRNYCKTKHVRCSAGAVKYHEVQLTPLVGNHQGGSGRACLLFHDLLGRARDSGMDPKYREGRKM